MPKPRYATLRTLFDPRYACQKSPVKSPVMEKRDRVTHMNACSSTRQALDSSLVLFFPGPRYACQKSPVGRPHDDDIL